ncbi:hypothetical protein TGARI_263610A, partial [Toxoplasma gondii ARI]
MSEPAAMQICNRARAAVCSREKQVFLSSLRCFFSRASCARGPISCFTSSRSSPASALSFANRNNRHGKTPGFAPLHFFCQDVFRCMRLLSPPRPSVLSPGTSAPARIAASLSALESRERLKFQKLFLLPFASFLRIFPSKHRNLSSFSRSPVSAYASIHCQLLTFHFLLRVSFPRLSILLSVFSHHRTTAPSSPSVPFLSFFSQCFFSLFLLPGLLLGLPPSFLRSRVCARLLVPNAPEPVLFSSRFSAWFPEDDCASRRGDCCLRELSRLPEVFVVHRCALATLDLSPTPRCLYRTTH